MKNLKTFLDLVYSVSPWLYDKMKSAAHSRHAVLHVWAEGKPMDVYNDSWHHKLVEKLYDKKDEVEKG